MRALAPQIVRLLNAIAFCSPAWYDNIRLGRAYNRVRADATAFVHRKEPFLLKHAVVIDADASTAATETARDWLARSWALARWGTRT